MLTEQALRAATLAACRRYGAQRVYDAAHQAMAGHHAALARVELLLAAGNMPALVLVASHAYAAMNCAEQAADLAEAIVDLARIGSA